MAAKIKAVINFTTKELKITPWGGIRATEKLIFKILDVNGGTIYLNAGYGTSPNFASPDIDGSDPSLDLTISLPLDSENLIEQGNYTLIYYSEAVPGFKPTSGSIRLTYCATAPSVLIKQEYSCLTSTLVSTDDSNYSLTCTCGSISSIDVDSVTYDNHTVSYPDTMETPIADVVTTTAINSIPANIWTGRWVSRITAELSYVMPSIAFDGSVIYYVEGTVSGIRSIDVICGNCLCSMYICIKQMFTNYMNEIGRNPALAERYETLLVRLNALYTLYAIAQSCGSEVELASICGQIEALINISGCVCCGNDTTDDYSVEVIPVIGSGSSAFGGTIWYDGEGTPSPTIGVSGDFYLDTLNKIVYKKTIVGWVSQFAITFTGTSGNYLMASDNIIVASTSDVYTEVKAFEFDVNEVADGSVLQVISNMRFNEPTDSGTALRFNIVGATTDSIPVRMDASFNGTQFSIVAMLEYCVKDIGGVLTIVSATLTIFSQMGIVYYDYRQINIALNATLTPNEINLLVKSSDNITNIYVDNFRVNHLRTI